MTRLVLALGLVGTFVFALAGATAGVTLRVFEIHRDWQLPRAKVVDDNAEEP